MSVICDSRFRGEQVTIGVIAKVSYKEINQRLYKRHEQGW